MPIFSIPPCANISCFSISINLYLMELLPQLKTNTFIFVKFVVYLFLDTYCLIGSNDDHFVDIVHGASTGKVVDRSSHALEDGTNGFSVGKTLNEFVCDIASFKSREDEDVGSACHGTAR